MQTLPYEVSKLDTPEFIRQPNVHYTMSPEMTKEDEDEDQEEDDEEDTISKEESIERLTRELEEAGKPTPIQEEQEIKDLSTVEKLGFVHKITEANKRGLKVDNNILN